MWVAVAALSVGINANGQDLLASQAPVDRTLRAIDSVALHRQIIREQMEHPGYGLYPSWDNERVHVYGDVKVPDTFRIDLRGFTMPTSSQKITSKFGYRRRFRRHAQPGSAKRHTFHERYVLSVARPLNFFVFRIDFPHWIFNIQRQKYFISLRHY